MKTPITILILFLAFNLFAQAPLFEREVPQAVKKAFVDKYPETTTAEWFKVNDSIIEARFTVSRKKTSAAFSNNGDFLSSSSEITPKETPGMISNYIRGEHPNDVVQLAMMAEDAKGQISYYVEIKRPGVNQAVTKLYFDFYGNLTKIIKPEEIKQEEDAEGGFSDDLDADVAAGEPIKKKELPSKVNSYIDNNYKDYRFDNALFINHDEHGIIYQVNMRRLGYKEFINVHFDLMGNFIDIPQK